MLQKIHNILQSKIYLSHVKLCGKMVTPCLDTYMEYLQAAAALCPFQPREQINHFAITLSRSLSTCALFAPRRRLDACYYCVDSSRRPARSVGRSESYGEWREGERSNVKRYGQRHAQAPYNIRACSKGCCILPSSVLLHRINPRGRQMDVMLFTAA